MISILFLIPTLDRGGAENVLVDLVNHMDQSKFQITVQTLFDKDSQKDRLREGIEYKSFLYHQFHGNSRLQARIPARLLYRLIVRKRYDIVVSYLEGPTTHIISGCPYPDSKRVAWVHVEMDNMRQLSVGFRSEKEAVSAYQKVDKVVFVADSVRKTFEKVVGKQLNNTTVLYNTINSKRIRKKAQEPLQSLEFSSDEFNIVTVGRIISAKGYDRLARVHKRLIESGHKVHVYVLGSGSEQKSIENYLSENKLNESFTFLGFKENPYNYVAKADLFVCSSRREGFSTAVSEALILGIPVVSTNCSGANELLGDSNEYGIVTENNEEAIYEGIKGLMDEPNQLIWYKKQAVTKGKEFSIDKTVSAVEEMISDLAEIRNQ